MRDILFIELRKCCEAMSMVKDEQQINREAEILCDTIAYICQLSDFSRTEGLLALEEEIEKHPDKPEFERLKDLMELFVDGTGPSEIEEIGTARFFAENLSGTEALQDILIISGALAIADGLRAALIERKLLSFLPKEYEQRCRNLLKQGREIVAFKAGAEERKNKIEGQPVIDPGDSTYYLIKTTDYALRAMDGKDLQAVMRVLDDDTLTIAMKGLSAACRMEMLSNIPQPRSASIMLDYESMGPVRVSDVSNAILHVFQIIMDLIDKDEVTCPGEDALRFVQRLYGASEKDLKTEASLRVEEELYELLRDSMDRSKRMV